MSATIRNAAESRPTLSEIDAFGLTHTGHVRSTNNDHFLIASFHRSLRVHHTSLPGPPGDVETQSRGFLMLVADGVGGLATAGEGSALAVATLTQHLLHATEICSALVLLDEAGTGEMLRAAVLHAHEALVAWGTAEGEHPATTLTMFAGFWPRAFVVHVGDSRLYRLRDGTLERFTADQTYEQLMLEAGAIKAGGPESQRLRNVLWSAVGNDEVVPQVRLIDLTRRDVTLLCTDGLTRHVTDEEIRAHLQRDISAEATCRTLVDLALARGGKDNVTVVVGRVRAQRERA